jgi:tetratricopeptide (TPR) repeat protein
VPVIGLVPFGDFAVADRYTYIPSIGVMLACAAALEKLLSSLPRVRWLTAGAVALACLAVLSGDIPRWHDSISLYNAALEIGPHYVTYNNRGAALWKAGKPEPALKDFEAAIQLNPKFAAPYNNRASILSEAGRYDEAMRELEKAIEQDRNFASAYNNRGNIYAHLGQPARAIEDYDRCVKLRPNHAMQYNNRAAAYYDLRRFAEANADLEMCRRLGGEPHPGLVRVVSEAMHSTH